MRGIDDWSLLCARTVVSACAKGAVRIPPPPPPLRGGGATRGLDHQSAPSRAVRTPAPGAIQSEGSQRADQRNAPSPSLAERCEDTCSSFPV